MQDLQTQVFDPDTVPLNSREISLLDLLLVFARNKRMIWRVSIGVALFGLVVALLMPKIYTGHTVILTPTNPVSLATALSGDAGLLSQLTTTGGGLGLTDPNDVWVATLRGDAISMAIIKRFDLQKLYEKDTMVETLNTFRGNATINSGRDGTISIDFDDEDPKRAAAVANAYVEELRTLSRQMTMSAASKRRQYFESQFEKAKQVLADAEVALRKSQENTGLLDLDKQAGAVVAAIATVQGQIAAQQVLIQGLRTGSTSRNPDIIRAEQELAAMRVQLAELQHRQQSGKGDIVVSTERLPGVAQEYIRRLRDVKYYEAVYDIFAKQYEAAVADENGIGADVQVVDSAWIPDRKSKPKRALIVLGFLVLGLAASYSWAVIRFVWARIEEDSASAPTAIAIREELASGWMRSLRSVVGRIRGKDHSVGQ
jgi:tyrosine-protein kinase Etk/Wzc